MFRSKSEKKADGVRTHPNRCGEERYPYLEADYRGDRIERFGLDAYGMPVVVIREEGAAQPYVVASGYSPRDGHWARGSYHVSREDAVSDWRGAARYPDVDLDDQRTFEFMRAGRYNWNNVSADYLERHDYREDGFDTYPRSTDYRDDRVSREEWARRVDEHIVRNPSSKPVATFLMDHRMASPDRFDGVTAEEFLAIWLRYNPGASVEWLDEGHHAASVTEAARFGSTVSRVWDTMAEPGAGL